MIVGVRWLASLLLAAGILGCSSVPLRDTGIRETGIQHTGGEPVVAQADAGGVEYFAIDFVEPTGATSPPPSAYRDRGAGAYLHIPAEYVERLNWDPEAFEEAVPAGQPGVEEREEEGVRPQRDRPRRRSWSRSRGRRAGGRKFRTTGYSVTVSRYGRGHPVGRPGHAIGVPGQAVGRPGQAVGRPGHAVKPPAHAVKLPGQAVGLPGHAVRRPAHAVKLPGQAVNLPGHAVRRPGHPVRRPGHAVQVPGHPLKSGARKNRDSGTRGKRKNP